MVVPFSLNAPNGTSGGCYPQQFGLIAAMGSGSPWHGAVGDMAEPTPAAVSDGRAGSPV